MATAAQVGYPDIQTGKEALRLIEEYLQELTTRHPDELRQQLDKSVFFAVGYLRPVVRYHG